jgi:hypothetical protein
MSPTKKRKANTTPRIPETPRIPPIPQHGLPSTVRRRINLIKQENPQHPFYHQSTQYPPYNNNAMYNTRLYTITDRHGRNYTIAHTRKKQRYTSPLILSPIKFPNNKVSPTNNTETKPKSTNTSQKVHNNLMRHIRAYKQTHERKN